MLPDSPLPLNPGRNAETARRLLRRGAAMQAGMGRPLPGDARAGLDA